MKQPPQNAASRSMGWFRDALVGDPSLSGSDNSLICLLVHGDLIVAWQKICTLTKSVYTPALEREYGGRVASRD